MYLSIKRNVMKLYIVLLNITGFVVGMDISHSYENKNNLHIEKISQIHFFVVESTLDLFHPASKEYRFFHNNKTGIYLYPSLNFTQLQPGDVDHEHYSRYYRQVLNKNRLKISKDKINQKEIKNIKKAENFYNFYLSDLIKKNNKELAIETISIYNDNDFRYELASSDKFYRFPIIDLCSSRLSFINPNLFRDWFVNIFKYNFALLTEATSNQEKEYYDEKCKYIFEGCITTILQRNDQYFSYLHNFIYINDNADFRETIGSNGLYCFPVINWNTYVPGSIATQYFTKCFQWVLHKNISLLQGRESQYCIDCYRMVETETLKIILNELIMRNNLKNPHINVK